MPRTKKRKFCGNQFTGPLKNGRKGSENVTAEHGRSIVEYSEDKNGYDNTDSENLELVELGFSNVQSTIDESNSDVDKEVLKSVGEKSSVKFVCDVDGAGVELPSNIRLSHRIRVVPRNNVQKRIECDAEGNLLLMNYFIPNNTYDVTITTVLFSTNHRSGATSNETTHRLATTNREEKTKCKVPASSSDDVQNSTEQPAVISEPRSLYSAARCEVCQRDFSSFSLLERHRCGKSVTSYEAEGSDGETTTEFTCSTCTKSFLSRYMFNRHKPTCLKKVEMKKAGLKLVVCSICGKSVKGSNIRQHEQIHSGEKPFECGTCGKKFRLKNCLWRHEARAHSIQHPNKTYFPCSVCGTLFMRKHELVSHNRIKHLRNIEKKHECDQCEFRTTSKLALIDHKNTHSGAKPYKCKICGGEFPSSTSLYRHRSLHSSEKRFVCSHCGAAFKSAYNLRTHERIHTGAKPYSCKVCDMKFMYYAVYKTHERSHSGVTQSKPKLECRFCERKFCTKMRLTRHENSHLAPEKDDPLLDADVQ